MAMTCLLTCLQVQLERSEQAMFSQTPASGDNLVGKLQQQLSELTAKSKKEIEEKDAEIRALQEKFSQEMAQTANKLADAEKEKSKLSADMQNQSLANQSLKHTMQRTLEEDKGVTDVQLQQMEKMVDSLTKESQGLYLFIFEPNICTQCPRFA